MIRNDKINVYSTEKLIKENKDKISEPVQKQVEAAVTKAKAAMDDDIISNTILLQGGRAVPGPHTSLKMIDNAACRQAV